MSVSEEAAARLKAQLLFYFSDSNYPRDKFLRGKAAENDGYVPLSVILSFSRVKAITSDVNDLVQAARSCEELVLDEKETMVKRAAPIPEKDTINERSVYVKGLPLDDPTVTIESVGELFAPFSKVLSVRLRRDKEKNFKGKAYVELLSPEATEKAAHAQLAWGSGDSKQELTVLTKGEYLNQRKQKMKDIKAEKKRARELEKPTNNKDGFAPGLLLEVKNVPSDTDRDVLTELFSRFGKVRYVDFHGKDEMIAIVRFTDNQHTKDALAEINEKKIKVGENVLDGQIIEGEAEKKYWDEKVLPFTGNKKPNRSNFGANKRRR